MPDPIPYLDLRAQIKPLRAELDAAIAKTIDNCSFCLGPDVAQFEKDFAKYCGAEHCVAFNSGTSALHVAMLLLGVGPGDEVITTPFTFVATSWAISEPSSFSTACAEAPARVSHSHAHDPA